MSSVESGESTSSPYAIKALPKHPPAPISLEEKSKQMSSVLSAIELLKEIETRGDFISVLEVQQLREALSFATGEKSSVSSEKENNPSGAVEPTIVSALEMHYENTKATADRLLTSLEKYAASKLPSFSYCGGNACRGEGTLWERWKGAPRHFVDVLAGTLVVSTFNFFIGGSLSLLVVSLLLYCRYTMPFMLVYLVFIFTVGRPRFPVKRNMAFARLDIWKYYRDYFPTRFLISKEVRAKFNNEKNYIFLYHPHGVLSFGALLNFALDVNRASKALPWIQIHVQSLKFNFFIPFFRQVLLFTGCGDASASAIRQTLRAGKGESVLLVVGGAEEAIVSRPCTNDLVLKKRVGFVKIALQEGAALVPVYGFGENGVFEHSKLADHPLVRRGVKLIKRLTGVAIPILKGVMPGVAIMPLRKPIIVVVGKPVELPKIENPTAAEIDYWRGKYIEALQNLYEEYRRVYDLKSTGLRVVE